MRERRFFKGAEVRATGDGHIEGHAAVFNQEYVLWDSPSLRVTETVRPGTFSRVLSDKEQDPRCLFNHDPNQILGRKSAGTLTMEQNSKGLKFSCEPPETQAGRDVRTNIQNRNITGCSFAFTVSKQKRTEEEKEGKLFILREIQEVDNLYDVGPVTYPAYEGTDVAARSLELRGIFPDGVPKSVLEHAPELRAQTDPPNTDPDDDGDDDTNPNGDTDDDMEECSCGCRACYSAECNECDMNMQTCGDSENCATSMRSKRSVVVLRDGAKTKRVDGEDLTEGDFIYVGDPNDPSTWSLPWKFSTEAKTKSHLQNALARFNQTKNIPSDKKAAAYKKLVGLAKKHGIHVGGDDSEKNSSFDHAVAVTRTLQAEIGQ